MRERKFRAWHKHLKQMFDVYRLSSTAVEERKNGFIYTYDRNDVVVMQGTGLRDMHKQPIYEGDIVRQRFCYAEGESWDYGSDERHIFGYHIGYAKVLPSRGVVVEWANTYEYDVKSVGGGREAKFFNVPLEEILIREGIADNLDARQSVSRRKQPVQLCGSRCEIIGNMFEHHELLEVEQ